MTKILSQKDYFWLKNDGEKWSRFFYYEILHAPSEIPANLPIQPFWADFFALGSSNSEGGFSVTRFDYNGAEKSNDLL